MKIKEEWYKKLISNYECRLIEKVEDPKNFGNELVTLSSSDLIIRYVSDRSDLRIEIASRSDSRQWFDLDIIYAHIERKKNLMGKYSFEELNAYLLNNYHVVRALFADDNYLKTKERLLKLMHSRAKHIFNEL